MARVPCLFVSERPEDLKFGNYLATAHSVPMHVLTHVGRIRDFLVDNPGSLCFLDGDNRAVALPVLQLVQDTRAMNRIFVITTRALSDYPYLFKHPSYSHHIFRRYGAPGPQAYARLLEAAMVPYPFGIERYMSGKAATQRITLKKSRHKGAAVEAMQNYFNKLDLNSRLAALGAQATDELIMNAIFDAPVDAQGTRYRRGLDRAADFELSEREWVEIQVAGNADYVGISVADQFGSLQKETVLGFLRKDYSAAEYRVRKNDPSAGLGLLGCMQAGLSLLFICKPRVRTEVMIFFPKARTFKAFREGFRFVSVMSE